MGDLTLGIDFGSTKSAVAVYRKSVGSGEDVQEDDDGDVEVLANDIEGRTTPSCVYLQANEQPQVGEAAVRLALSDPHNAVRNVKRILGRSLQSVKNDQFLLTTAELRKDVDRQACAIRLQDENSAGEVMVTPEEVAAAVLGDLRTTARRRLGQDVRRAVVAVPSYFDAAQRLAVVQSGKLAGLEVVRLCNETSATALAYARLSPKEDVRTAVVVDVGGGGGSVAVVDVKGRKHVEVRVCSGTRLLGGEDLDETMMMHLLDMIEEETKKSNASSSLGPHGLEKLRSQWRDAKKKLSFSHPSATIKAFLPDLKRDVQLVVKKEDFERVVDQWLTGIMTELTKVFRDSKVPLKAVSDVLLVGASTRIPQLRTRIEKFFDKKCCKVVNPDEGVAIGAALLSDSATLLEVTAHDLHAASCSWKSHRPTIPAYSQLPVDAKTSGSRLWVFQGSDEPILAYTDIWVTDLTVGRSGLIYFRHPGPRLTGDRLLPGFCLASLTEERCQQLFSKMQNQFERHGREIQRAESKNELEEKLRELSLKEDQDGDDPAANESLRRKAQEGLRWLVENPNEVEAVYTDRLEKMKSHSERLEEARLGRQREAAKRKSERLKRAQADKLKADEERKRKEEEEEERRREERTRKGREEEKLRMETARKTKEEEESSREGARRKEEDSRREEARRKEEDSRREEARRKEGEERRKEEGRRKKEVMDRARRKGEEERRREEARRKEEESRREEARRKEDESRRKVVRREKEVMDLASSLPPFHSLRRHPKSADADPLKVVNTVVLSSKPEKTGVPCEGSGDSRADSVSHSSSSLSKEKARFFGIDSARADLPVSHANAGTVPPRELSKAREELSSFGTVHLGRWGDAKRSAAQEHSSRRPAAAGREHDIGSSLGIPFRSHPPSEMSRSPNWTDSNGENSRSGVAARSSAEDEVVEVLLKDKTAVKNALTEMRNHFTAQWSIRQLYESKSPILWSPSHLKSMSSIEIALVQTQEAVLPCIAEAECIHVLQEAHQTGVMVLIAEQCRCAGGRELVYLAVRFVLDADPVERLLAVREASATTGQDLLRRFEELCDKAGVTWKSVLYGVSVANSSVCREFLEQIRCKDTLVKEVWNSAHRLDEKIALECYTEKRGQEFFAVLDELREIFLIEKWFQVLQKSCASVKVKHMSTYEQIVHLLESDLVGVKRALSDVVRLDMKMYIRVKTLQATFHESCFQRDLLVFAKLLNVIASTAQLLTFPHDLNIYAAERCLQSFAGNEIVSEIVKELSLIDYVSPSDKETICSMVRRVESILRHCLSMCSHPLLALHVLQGENLPQKFLGNVVPLDCMRVLRIEAGNCHHPLTFSQVLKKISQEQSPTLYRNLMCWLTLPISPCKTLPAANQVHSQLHLASAYPSDLLEPTLLLLSSSKETDLAEIVIKLVARCDKIVDSIKHL